MGNYADPWLTWTDARRKPPAPCRWPDCDDAKIQGHGMCNLHYQRGARLGNFEAPWEAWLPEPCEHCGEAFVGRNRVQRFCSDACAIGNWKVHNTDRLRELGRRHSSRRRARIAATTVEPFTDDDVRLAHGETCYLCSRRVNFKLSWPHPDSPSLDHVVPISRGGTHTLDNVAFVHLVCNHRKNARPTTLTPVPTLFGVAT